MDEIVKYVLLNEDEISTRVCELGQEISTKLKGQDLLVLCVLNGASLFCADLVRKIDLDVQLEFITAKSYGHGFESTHHVQISNLDRFKNSTRHILIVEDIIDSGNTLKSLKSNLGDNCSICVLLDKINRREVEVYPDFVGFSIPDEFVVGYGLNYKDSHRNLPYIGVVKPEYTIQ